ncbi:T-cell surface glycoprotein CD3 epsilon chain-like isoform X2 [Pseudoliparis swirei]|uniref:T-cell surface glycoprotein CD3 epsilon chain-like isoform X2 n=1 Tax=Pseudoliparis swirei TaxID=2059687 RepID=UPI0024BD776F|nr:T-cell surface glycoprotein CD3 epsilon chain-like isoform X2 [Pseudoliparis swirei]
MNSTGVRAALLLLLLLLLLLVTAAATAAEGGVTFWQKDFTMVCPQTGMWFRKLEKGPNYSQSYTLQYGGYTRGVYHCKYFEHDKEITYYFYVKGKVCDNCYELDAVVVGWTIVGDVVATACVMAFIYRCTKKKSSAGLTHASKAARPGGRPPPPRSPDYELSPHTRSQDPYSAVNRTG